MKFLDFLALEIYIYIYICELNVFKNVMDGGIIMNVHT